MAQSQPLDDNEREGALQLATALGLNTSDSTVGCSITAVRRSGGYVTPVASGRVARDLDEAQYRSSLGPCVSAASEQRTYRIDVISDQGRWPTFIAVAATLGVRSSLSLPLPDAPERSALNFYSSEVSGYRSSRATSLAGMVANAASALMNERPSDQPAERVDGEELERAMATREIVLRARDMLMVTDGVDATQAYLALTLRSAAERRPLREIACDVLNSQGGDSSQDES